MRRQSAAAFKRAMAEKLRAALTRRDVAIRDLYDLDHADPRQDLDLKSRSFIALVRKKLAVPGSGQVDISEERLGQLKRQVALGLKAVLDERAFSEFDLDRAWATVTMLAKRFECSGWTRFPRPSR